MRPRYIGYDKYVLVSSVELKIAWISPLLVSIKLPTECIFQQDRISALGWFESHLMVQNRFLLVISSLYSQVLLEGYIQAMFFLHECRYRDDALVALASSAAMVGNTPVRAMDRNNFSDDQRYSEI